MTKAATLSEALLLPATERYELLVDLWESLENEKKIQCPMTCKPSFIAQRNMPRPIPKIALHGKIR